MPTENRVVSRVASAITKGVSPIGIMDQLAPHVSPANVAAALSQLTKLGLIEIEATRSGHHVGNLKIVWRSENYGPLTEKLVSLIDVCAMDVAELNVWPGCPIHCCVAWYPLVASLQVKTDLDRSSSRSFDIVSGRGGALADAVLGCLAEAAERYSAQYFGSELVIRSSCASMKKPYITPNDLMHFSQLQLQRRGELNEGKPEAFHIPMAYSPDWSIDWIAPAEGLSSASRLVPAAYAFLGFPHAPAQGFCVPDSNGCAVGATREDAAIRGFFELVERDAVAVWWYNRLRRPGVDLENIHHPHVQACADWSRGKGRSLRLIDISHDFGIAVVAAVSSENDGSGLAFGFAASHDKESAAEHAISEMVQFELNAELRKKRKVEPAGALADDFLTWARDARIDEHPHLEPLSAAVPIELESAERWTLDRCHQVCFDAGLEFLAVDLTRPDVGVPVVRTIVPGLRPHWPRFAPGRLYDVPVVLGWRDFELDEAELNHTHIVY